MGVEVGAGLVGDGVWVDVGRGVSSGIRVGVFTLVGTSVKVDVSIADVSAGYCEVGLTPTGMEHAAANKPITILASVNDMRRFLLRSVI